MTFAQWLQVWGAIGSTVLIVAMALLKRRWRVVDQRQLSNKTLRNAAKLYQEAYRRQEEYLQQMLSELHFLFSLKSDEPETEAHAKFILARVKWLLERKPDFMAIAQQQIAEDIDNLEIPAVEEMDLGIEIPKIEIKTK
jgi:hypothetical protein